MSIRKKLDDMLRRQDEKMRIKEAEKKEAELAPQRLHTIVHPYNSYFRSLLNEIRKTLGRGEITVREITDQGHPYMEYKLEWDYYRKSYEEGGNEIKFRVSDSGVVYCHEHRKWIHRRDSYPWKVVCTIGNDNWTELLESSLVSVLEDPVKHTWRNGFGGSSTTTDYTSGF